MKVLLTLQKKKYLAILTGGIFLLLFYYSLHTPLFYDPLCTVITDKNGKLLGAKIASDGQWRFPKSDSIPEKFEIAIRYFEDEYFYYHPGINPVSMAKALYTNLKSGRNRRGGSTLTSQTIRLSRQGKKRTYLEKIIESYLAIRLEFSFSKDEILNYYASYAPFGGNVVGLEAASWRYFGRSQWLLSWGETATLAVLPNSPSLIYPGKNQNQLLIKRNRLLDKLYENGEIDAVTCLLAKSEPLPGRPKPLPRMAPHLLDRAIADGKAGSHIASTIEATLQDHLSELIAKHHHQLKFNQIHNAALLVVEVETGNVLAYVGNTAPEGRDHANSVDLITSKRSSGSILKPFLYAFSQQEGLITPAAILPDIPTQIAGYSPLNFDKTYDGAVSADQALSRSLNIPAVRLLQRYGLEKFLFNLQKLGFNTINKSADHYGLSLILGGAEVRLWDLAGTYAKMAHHLAHQDNSGKITYGLKYSKDTPQSTPLPAIIENSASWITFEALTEMNRPIEGTQWRQYESSRKIAWKTGTSYGHRDAWAIGITPQHVVAVWVGNADGEGRPDLTGARSAAPIMFDAFRLLKSGQWFSRPEIELIQIETCRLSGQKAGKYCHETERIFAADKSVRTTPCSYHQIIHLDSTLRYQVNSSCYSTRDMTIRSWYILPPVMEWFYKRRNPSYKLVPPLMHGCASDMNQMDIIYPRQRQQIFIPTGFDNEVQQVVVKAVHREPSATIYWHLDDHYLGSTTTTHQIEILPTVGNHKLTIVDHNGNELTRSFDVVK